MSKTLDLVREKYPAYAGVEPRSLALGIGNKYPAYLEGDPEFAAEYEDARHRASLEAEQRQYQREGDTLDQPTKTQLYVDAATRGPDLPRFLFESPGLAMGEAAGVLPTGTSRKVGDVVENLGEGSLSPLGIASLPVGGAGSRLVSPLLRRAAGVTLGGAATVGVGHAIKRASEEDPAGQIAAAVEGAANIAMLWGAGAISKAPKTGLPSVLDPTPAEGPTPPMLPERQLMAPRRPMPEFTESTLEANPPRLALPAPGESGATFALQPESPLGPRTAGYRIKVAPFVERVDAIIDNPRGAVENLQEAIKISDELEGSGAQPFEFSKISTDLRQLEKIMRLNTVPGEFAQPPSKQPLSPKQKAAVAAVRGKLDKIKEEEAKAVAHDEMKAALNKLFAPKEEPTTPKPTPPPEELPPTAPSEPLTTPPSDTPPATGGVTVPKSPAPTPAAPAESLNALVTDKVAEIESARTLVERNKLRRELQKLIIRRDAEAPEAKMMAPVLETAEKTVAEQPVVPPMADAIATTARQSVEAARDVEPLANNPSSATPSPDALPIVDQRSLAVYNWLKTFLTRHQRGEPLPVKLDTDRPFPRFSNYAQNKDIASRPNGFGRVPGLGFIFDPRAKLDSEAARIMQTLRFESTVGDGLSHIEANKIFGEIDKPAGITSKTKNGNLAHVVTPDNPEQSTHISDVLEALQQNPDAYQMAPDVRAALLRANAQHAEIVSLLKENGLAPDPSVEIYSAEGDLVADFKLSDVADIPAPPHFPRIAIKKEGVVDPHLPGVGGMLGAGKAFFEKTRLYKTEAVGARKGITYEPSIEARLYRFSRSAYRAIAEKRAVEQLKALGEARGSKQRRARLKASLSDDIAAGDITPESLEAVAMAPYWGESYVKAPRLQNYIFKKEVAEAIDKHAPVELGKYLQYFSNANNAAVSLLLGFDMSFMSIQMLSLMARNPLKYASTAKHALDALFHKDVLHKVLASEENTIAARELAQLGFPLGTVTDLQRGLASGQFLTRFTKGPLGVLSTTAKGAGRMFQTALDLSALEFWKIYRQTTPKSQWPALAENIGSATLRGRIEEIGTDPRRAFAERMLFQAPAYYRAALNMVATAVDPRTGASGHVARWGLGAAMGGGLITFYGMAKAVGLSEEEILRRLDPGSGDFAMVPINVLGMGMRNVGIGGPIRSFARLAGEIKDAAINDPGKLIDPTRGDDNPITHWFRGKLSPAPAHAWNWIQGKDFLGNDISPWTEAVSSAPIALQPVLHAAGEAFGAEQRGTAKTGIMDAATSFVGINSFTENQRAALVKKRSNAAQAKHDKAYSDLGMRDQLAISRELQRDPELLVPKTLSEEKRITAIATKLDAERRDRINKGLPEEMRKRMKELSVKPSSYEATISIGKTKLILTKKQLDQYEKLIIDEYTKVLARPLANKRLESLSPDKRQLVLNDIMRAAKTRARAKLIRSNR